MNPPFGEMDGTWVGFEVPHVPHIESRYSKLHDRDNPHTNPKLPVAEQYLSAFGLQQLDDEAELFFQQEDIQCLPEPCNLLASCSNFGSWTAPMACFPSTRTIQVAVLVAIASALLLSAASQESDSASQKHFIRAEQAQQQGLLDAAAEEYQTVLRLQPGLPEAFMNLGLVYYAQAKFEDAARALTKAEKLRPGMRGVSLWRGIDEVRLYQPQQAVVLLRDAVRTDPKDKLAQTWLATALWNAGQTDAALLQSRKASLQFPDDPDLLFARGEANAKAATQQTDQLLAESAGTALSDLIYGTYYADGGDWVKAESHLRRAIERDPHMLDARLNLAETYVRQARLLEAQEQLSQTLALSPQSATALARSGQIMLLTHQQADGLARIADALAIDSGEALDALGLPVEDQVNGVSQTVDIKLSALCIEAARSLNSDAGLTLDPVKDVAFAGLYALAGEVDSARQVCQRIAYKASGPGASANAFALAITAIHQHRYDDAETALLRWIAVHPGDRTARYQLILVRRKISMAQVTRLLAVAPDSYHLHQLLGQLFVNREQNEKALDEYLKVAAARPNLPDVHFWLGHLYWKLRDADQAIAALKQELQLSPRHPEARAELGTVLVTEDRAGEAIPLLESAIQTNPDLWPVYTQLGRAYAMEKNYPRAEQVLRRALTHDSDGNTHYQLGLVLRAEGMTAQAEQMFAQVNAIKAEQRPDLSPKDMANDGERK
jgi:tetratricopeptide (TPR) repeat protein